MSDDLIERLRHAHEHSQQRIVGSNIFQEAATALEAKDAKIEVLNKSYGLAVARSNEWRARAEQAERALAEAREIITAIAHIGVDFGYGAYVLEDKFIEAARQFVKEHSANAGQ